MHFNLFTKRIKYSELIEKNRVYDELQHESVYPIYVLSNITNFQFSPILEYTLKRYHINAKVLESEYDNIVQESFNSKNKNCVIIFWEISNFLENFENIYFNYIEYSKK